MTSFKYTASTIALLLASGMAQSANTTTQPGQPMKTLSGADCPAPGSVAEADFPAECKTAAGTQMPKQDNAAEGTATTTLPDSTAATTTTEMPKQDTTGTTATTVVPKSYNSTASETKPDSGTAEVPKTDDPAAGTATTVQPEADTAVTTTEMPKQDNTAATGEVDPAAAANVNPGNAVLASQFMGQTVYSGANESVGEINDIVMNRELANVVAIIGVGGFLGIGEKDVAIPIEELTVVKDENNNLRLTIAATKEQLEAAPAFDRTALK